MSGWIDSKISALPSNIRICTRTGSYAEIVSDDCRMSKLPARKKRRKKNATAEDSNVDCVSDSEQEECFVCNYLRIRSFVCPCTVTSKAILN